MTFRDPLLIPYGFPSVKSAPLTIQFVDALSKTLAKQRIVRGRPHRIFLGDLQTLDSELAELTVAVLRVEKIHGTECLIESLLRIVCDLAEIASRSIGQLRKDGLTNIHAHRFELETILKIQTRELTSPPTLAGLPEIREVEKVYFFMEQAGNHRNGIALITGTHRVALK
jgi:hypothetical protein